MAGRAAITAVVLASVLGLHAIAAADTLRLVAVPGVTIHGSIRSNEPGERIVEFEAFGERELAIPRGWIAHLEAAGEVDAPRRPQSADDWCARGDAMRARGSERGARSAYERALEAEPDHAGAQCGWLRLEAGSLIRAIERRPDDAGELLAPYRDGAPALAEYAAWRTLRLALELRENRDDVIRTLQRRLTILRRGAVATVNASSGAARYDVVTERELAEALADISELVHTPHRWLHRAGLRDTPDEWRPAIRTAAAVCAVREPVDTTLAACDRWLAELLPATAVGRDPDDPVVTANAAARAANAAADPSREMAFIGRVNDYRDLLGLHRLLPDDRLTAAARGHAEWMRDNRLVTHGGPLGNSTRRAIEAGYPRDTLVGENVQRTAEPDDGPAIVLQNFIDSPSHHALLVRADMRRTGVGAVDGYWCQLCATAPEDD